MAKNLDVTVDISAVSSAGYLGFGIPLILASKQKTAVGYVKCSSANEVATAISDTNKTSDTYKVASIIFSQKNAPREIAICHSTTDIVSAISAVKEKEWRQLIAIIGEGDTKTIADVATAIEDIPDKMYFVTVSSTSELSSVTDKHRTVAFYYDLKGSDENLVEPYAVAAFVGAVAGRTAGSFTYKNIILTGLKGLDKTSAEVSQIHTGKGITALEKCGDVVTSEGKNTKGEYIDIIDAQDYVISQIEYRVQKLLNNSPKLPYTNAGIAALESTVVGVLTDAYNNGIIDSVDGTPSYTVDFATREDMSLSNRQNRIYTGGNFSFTIAGAIHSVEIHGELVI